MRLSEDDIAYIDNFQGKNIKIEDFDSNRTYIFFSSNGIYIDNIDSINNVLVAQDRYEWENVSKDQAYNKIFVRDIKKSWYLNGVNKNESSVEALLQELKIITNGKRIVTVGNSSGGYAATLFGYLLNAEYVLNFSGQFVLFEKENLLCGADEAISDKYYPFLYDFVKNNMDCKYFDLRNFKSNVNVFYFVPFYSRDDNVQYEFVKNISNIHAILIASNIHGDCISGSSLHKVLAMNHKEILLLARYFSGKVSQKIHIERYML